MVSGGAVSVLGVLAVSFATAAATLLLVWAGILYAQGRRRRQMGDEAAAERLAFLFENDSLVDATPQALALLDHGGAGGSDWARLAGLLRQRFPTIDTDMARLAAAGRIEIVACSGPPDRVVAEWSNGIARITLEEAQGGALTLARLGLTDRQAVLALEAEVETLRGLVNDAPVALWKKGPDGAITWANETYVALTETRLGNPAALTWPLPEIFPLRATVGPRDETAAEPHRIELQGASGESAGWFEVQAAQTGDETLAFATPVSRLVRAEESLREFVQTLSKTFAHLPIGLAIFDRTRRLALFNPALTDLTQLDVGFLSSRPSLFAFLDLLRDKRQMPEQRDYRAWRERMARLESSAANGFVQERWTLPSGQTYRVTGRPHPDGAVAFLFEDISSEISLTRRFRAEIELGHNVLDALEEAIAVFSTRGSIILSNRAYAALWGQDPATTLGEISVIDATRLWQSATHPTPVWGDLRDFVSGPEADRVDWAATVRLLDGRAMNCRFLPLTGERTMVGFNVDVPGPALRGPAAAAEPLAAAG